MELFELTIIEANRLLKSKKISSVELTQAVLDRINALVGKIVKLHILVDAAKEKRYDT